MKTISVVVLAAGLALADPAVAQDRQKSDSRRVTAREQPTADRDDRRRDRDRETDVRRPMTDRVHVPGPDEDDERDERDRNRRRPIRATVLVNPSDPYYGYDGLYPGFGFGYGPGRVWRRDGGMSCLRLDDELEWAHDAWHWENDAQRGAAWYDEEHALLVLRIAQERRYSGCHRYGSDDHAGDCRHRGRSPLTGGTYEIAIRVLDILLSDVTTRRY